MNPMVFIKGTLIILFLSFFLTTLSACFMMPLMVGAMYDSAKNNKVDPKVNAAVSDLIEESVDALDGERGLFDRILIGEIKVKDNLISAGKFRKTLLETLRARNMGLVLEQDDRADSTSGTQEWPLPETQKVLTVLNTQLYQTGDRFLLAQQLVNIRTNRIIWSGIYAWPQPNSTQDPKDDTSLTIRP
jgi:hypothetical protein